MADRPPPQTTSIAEAGARGGADLARLVAEWMPRQRWFAGKARDVADMRIDQMCVIADRVLEVIVAVEYPDGAERYQVPLVEAPDDAPAWAVLGSAAGLRLMDATVDADASRLLARAALSERAWTAGAAAITGAPVAPIDDRAMGLESQAPARRLTGEQSNTSIVFGDQAILKIFRRLDEGENPDIEITRELTLAGFPHAPAQRGSLVLRSDGDVQTALAVLSEFVTAGRDGWELACAEVDSLAAAAPQTQFLAEVSALGGAVARLHTALRDRFGTRAAERSDLEGWAKEMLGQLDAVFETAQRRAAHAAAGVLDRADQIRGRLTDIATAEDPGPMTRTHGDLHLGQTLLAGGRWQLLDFEGEPSRSVAERRQLRSPLRDVAGMLRSFDYASAAERLSAGAAPPSPEVIRAAEGWRDEARRRFLDGYLEIAGEAEIVPASSHSIQVLLDAFELDKAVYELGYELANRPSWLQIPIGGILRVLERSAGRPTTKP
ncbi:MAG TPA: hypothetical protein VML96_00370 [Egibacteraceae bacterium]|nr:hypothetical protein [Egibacteraceae bacterium]